ncbi:putative peptidoglycan glycosyltransferase FtsW [Ponticaulis sp.]|uniref:peptidoglycan glycosyltransferase FtsW n=1 Tax=Ponticaulis sp. TaxID=2020902 RepID=UPI000B628DD9|nr:putative peptidoglycan glycosyltransferase FtsW [Ponticaulis sp.]MAJ09018.1 cell division protein FtsW [Ponticaulis sp.]RPG16810.1 MAG: cell division protein FtsW [Hyphomonadaceae bacterium TMED125]|tara:strand:+ start:45317 stop:46444 length:1128 start_codon:yes stop_codon:yes gene_type:complete
MTTLARSDTSMLAEWWRTVDHGIIIGAMVLLACGMLLSLAAGPTAAERIGYNNTFHFVFRHAGFVVGAIIIMLAASMLTESWARRLALLIFIGAFLLMAVLLVIGHEVKGSQRWISLGGFSIQPSEFVKPALIVLASWLLAQRQRLKTVPWEVLTFFLFAPTVGLLLLQPDVGQTALLTAAFLIAFFVSGLPLIWAAAFGVGGVLTGLGLYFSFEHVRYRIQSFLNPNEASYQLDQAHEAIARGGLLGVGPGEGRIKEDLPDPHTDFIYSVAGEEFGYIACLGLLIIFAVIALRGVMAASRRADPYPRAAGTALFFMFGLQAVINVGVNVGMLPTKGMTLPFISYGGSSMIGTALTLGLGLALTRKRAEFHPGIK